MKKTRRDEIRAALDEVRTRLGVAVLEAEIVETGGQEKIPFVAMSPEVDLLSARLASLRKPVPS